MAEKSCFYMLAAGSPLGIAAGARFRHECAAALLADAEARADENFGGHAWQCVRPWQDRQVSERVRRPRSSREPART